jgi:hypothetical protein
MSLLIVFTIVISFFKSSSLPPSSIRSSIYSKWLTFLWVLCIWYSLSALFSSCVNGVSGIEKNEGNKPFPWNIPLCIWMGFDCTYLLLCFY